MFIRHGIKNTLRSRKRTAVFFLLMTLLVTMLGASLGLTYGVTTFLNECREKYTTVGVLEYTGDGYPDLSRLDEQAAQSAASLDTETLLQEDTVLRWEPEQAAFGYLPEAQDSINVADVRDHAVLVVRCRGYREEQGAYASYVAEEIFARRYLGNALIYTDPVGREMVEGHYYLISGSFYDGITSSLFFRAEDYNTAAYLATGDTQETAIVDVTDADGGYTLPETSAFYDIAKTYDALTRSITVRASKHPEEYLAFQQANIGIAEGRFYTAQEAASGARVCLIPETLAEQLGKNVGDTLQLNLAVAPNSPVQDSYWAPSCFASEDVYTIVGIFSRHTDWNRTVFIPPVAGLDMTQNHASYTLGQFRLDNDTAQGFAAQAKSLLPENVRLTIYDQGYSAASAPLKNMQRMVMIVSAVCVLVGIVMLVLYGYLLVYRQRRIGKIMLQVGASKKNVYTYFLSGAAAVALPACIVGCFVSNALSGKLTALINRSVASTAEQDLRYSNSNISMRLELSQGAQRTGFTVFLLIALAVLALAMLSCLLFTALSVRKRRKKTRAHRSAQGAKSRALRGGAGKYALLSMRRGGFRSLLPIAAALCAAVLFCRLTATTEDYRDRLQEIRTQSEVRGYLSDFQGQRVDGVSVSAVTARNIIRMEHIEEVTITKSFYYAPAYVTHADGTTTDLGLSAVPTGQYALETYTGQFQHNAKLIATNGLRDAPAFLYASSIETAFLEGYDESFFDKPESGGESYPCMVSTSILEECGIELGDTLTVRYMAGFLGSEGIYGNFQDLQLLVVGSYVKEEGKDNIFVPMWPILSDEELYGEPGDWETYRRLQFLTLDSVVFRLDSCASLPEVRQSFSAQGFSEANHAAIIRTFVVLEDASYIATEKSVSQRLWYMERLFPVIFVLTELLAFVLALIQIQMRRKEQRIMRSVGASAATTFLSLFLEQALLCLLGIGIGVGVCLLSVWTAEGLLLTAGFALCWLLGAAFAGMRGSCGRLLRQRKESES